MAYIQITSEQTDILKVKSISWRNEFGVFMKKPEIEGIFYPIISSQVPKNEAWFIKKENLKQLTEIELDSDGITKVLLNIIEIMENCEKMGYKFLMIDPRTIYISENLEPSIYLYYPIFGKEDFAELNSFNLPITIKTRNSDYKQKNSYLIAELFAMLRYKRDYTSLDSSKEKLLYVREKLIDSEEYDYNFWFKRAFKNHFTIQETKQSLNEILRHVQKRKIDQKKVIKLARSTRTYEGTTKLKEDDDYVDDPNQDSYFYNVRTDRAIFAVMDGVSNSKVGNGRVASNIVRDVLSELWNTLQDITNETVEAFFKNVIEESNKRIYEKAKTLVDEFLPSDLMSTTFAAVILKDDDLYILSIGDSNVYLFHKDYFLKLNPEHNVMKERVVEKKLRSGNEDDLTEYIGKFKKVDQKIVPDTINYYFAKTKILDDEILVICSDGVIDYWPRESEEESEEKFHRDFYDIYEKYRILKVASQRIISILDFSDVRDNVTIHLVKPVFLEEKSEISNLMSNTER